MTEDLRTAIRPNAGFPSATAAGAQALSRLTDLARKSLQIQASLARQSVDLTWATLAGDLDRTSANKAYIESVGRETVRYWRTMAELGVDYATDLVTLGKSVSTTVLREVAAASHRRGAQRQADTIPGSTDSTADLMPPEVREPQRTLLLASSRPSFRASDASDASGPNSDLTAAGRGPRHSA